MKKLPTATEGFIKRQRNRPNKPKPTKIKVRAGEQYKSPDGTLYEIVELYGALAVLNKDVPYESVLEIPVSKLKDPKSSVSLISAHDFKTYEKVKR